MLGGLRCSHVRPNTSQCSAQGIMWQIPTQGSPTPAHRLPHTAFLQTQKAGESPTPALCRNTVCQSSQSTSTTLRLSFSTPVKHAGVTQSDSAHVDSNAGVLDQMLLLPLSPDPRKGCCMPQGTPPPPRQKGESHQTPSRRHRPRSFLEFLTNFILHSYPNTIRHHSNS